MSVTEAETETVELPEASERYEMFAEWLHETYGYETDPSQLQVAVQRYGEFQRSDVNRQANEARKQANAQAREERRKRWEERRAAAAAKREERAASVEAGRSARRTKKAVKVSGDESDSETTVTVAKKKASDKPRESRKTSEDAPF